MDLNRSAHYHNIGTFWLTVVVIALMVWLRPPKAISQSATSASPVATTGDGKTNSNTKPDPPERQFMNWIMPSILAFAIVVGGALQFAAARHRARLDDPSHLIIHSAIFRVWGSTEQIRNLTAAVRALIKNNALNFDPGAEFGDPFPDQPKTFDVDFSLNGSRRLLSRANGERIVIPPIEPFPEAAQTETEADKKRRMRIKQYIDKLSVPQKFALRLVVKYGRIHHDILVKCGAEAGFGDNADGYIDRIGNVMELVTVDNGDYLINAAYIDDVDKALAAWFTRIASASEVL